MKTEEKEFVSAVKIRKSILAFDNRDVSGQILHELFETARWSASASNYQPWRFVYARKSDSQEAFEKILSVLDPGNQIWAKNAPVLMLIGAATLNPRTGTHNRFYMYDTGQAASSFALRAASLGLNIHQMGGFDIEAARQFFPENVEPASAVAIGYEGDPDSLPEKLRERTLAPRVRKSVEEIVRKLD